LNVTWYKYEISLQCKSYFLLINFINIKNCGSIVFQLQKQIGGYDVVMISFTILIFLKKLQFT